MEGLGAASPRTEESVARSLALIRSDLEQVLVWVIEVERWSKTSGACFFPGFGIRAYGVKCGAMCDARHFDAAEYLFELGR